MKINRLLIVVAMLALGAGVPWCPMADATVISHHWKFDLPEGGSIGDDIVSDTALGTGLVATAKSGGLPHVDSVVKYADASSGGGTASADLNNAGAYQSYMGSYLCVPDNDTLTGHASGGDGFTSLTIDVMVDPESFPFVSNYVVYKYENYDAAEVQTANGYYLNVRDNGEVRFQIGTSTRYARVTSAPGIIQTDGGWYHLRGVWDEGKVSLYIDDMETPKATTPFNDTLDNTVGALGIGCILRGGDGTGVGTTVGSGSYFDGRIDELQIWGESNAVFLPGDANLDMVVDEEDAAILAANWLTVGGAGWMKGDFSGDGAVNDIDATIMAANWQGSAASAQVPEPATMVLLISGLLLGCLLWFRRAA